MPQNGQTHLKNLAANATKGLSCIVWIFYLIFWIKKIKWDKVFKNGPSKICGNDL